MESEILPVMLQSSQASSVRVAMLQIRITGTDELQAIGLARSKTQTANTLLTVARIAYLSSDVVVSVQPAIGTDSEFSSHLNRYAGRKDSSLVAQSADTVPQVSLLYGQFTPPSLGCFPKNLRPTLRCLQVYECRGRNIDGKRD